MRTMRTMIALLRPTTTFGAAMRLGAVGATGGAAALSMSTAPVMAAEPTLSSLNPSVRVVTYNVLSSHLCEPTHYTACAPEDLDPPTRLRRVQEQLRPHIDAGAVLCLQELSDVWVGALVPYFEERGYTLVSGRYGRKFNGYMGVALAWPTARFESEAVDISRAADTVAPWPAAPEKAGGGGVLGSIQSRWRRLVRWAKGAKPPLEPWTEAERRQNVLVSAKLRCKRSGRLFAVTTYHMPCLFGSDKKCQVMTIHAAIAARHAKTFANGVPYVLAGDFNFKPDSAQYALVTNGGLAADHPQAPPPRAEGAWAPCASAAPLRSAYAIKDGAEPEFTNLAFSSWSKEPFSGCLDYIFLSEEWGVGEVKPLKKLSEEERKSYPSWDEPSDHVMIWADVEMGDARPAAAA